MHVFTTSLEWKGGQKLVSRCDGRPDLEMSSPPVFGGEAGKWTPEDLVGSAVEACLVLTTLFFVKKNNIGLRSWRSEARSTVEKGAGGLRFQCMDVHIHATVASEEDRARLEQAVHTAENFCPVSQAFNFKITAHINATVAA